MVAFSGTWKAEEEEISVDVVIYSCEVDIADIQFPIRMVCNFLELFVAIYAIIAFFTRMETKLGCDELTFIE